RCRPADRGCGSPPRGTRACRGHGGGLSASPLPPPLLIHERPTSMTHYKVGYLIGSLARESINRKLAGALIRLAPENLAFTEIPFADLPLYSYDYDADFPAVARAFKDAIRAVDALLFVTPEYNRAIPGGLKNAIDWASRPYGNNSFTNKPSAVI